MKWALMELVSSLHNALGTFGCPKQLDYLRRCYRHRVMGVFKVAIESSSKALVLEIPRKYLDIQTCPLVKFERLPLRECGKMLYNPDKYGAFEFNQGFMPCHQLCLQC